MRQLGPIMILNIDGMNRVSFRFSEVNEKTGTLISENNKKTACILDQEAESHIEWLREHIRENYLED